MALNYLSGRVSRIAAGIPGVSTAGDLTVSISGALGIDTFRPRADADVPNISIRGDLVDSNQQTGGIGYYLSQDADGVKWVETPPIISNAIFVFDNDRIVGLGSFTGLNFFTGEDDDLIQVTEDPNNPNIAKIFVEPRWVRNQYNDNNSLSTSFGSDGTFWSLPGYGTSQASGITSIGIGTNQPQADLQVGIGSTGVQIYGEDGRVEAEKIVAKDIEVDGNIEVESLIVRPGIATLAFLEVENDARIPLEYVGFSSIREARVTQLFADNVQAGLTTLGFGGKDVFILDDLFVQGGIGTFDNDVFVGGDLTVQGSVFFKFLEVENANVTGVITGRAGVFTDFSIERAVLGVATAGQIGFNTGIGTALTLENLGVSSIATITNAVVGFASITNETVGIATIGQSVTGVGTINVGRINSASIGIATIGVVSVTGPLYVGGGTTLAGDGGITTTGGDLYVGKDLYVAGQTEFGQIFAQNILVSGATTSKLLDFAVGFGTTATFSEANIGIATVGFAGINTAEIVSLGATNVRITGVATINQAQVTDASILNLTGNNISYGIGTISQLYAGIITGNNLAYSGVSTIGPATFTSELVSIGSSLDQFGKVTVGVSKTVSAAGIVTTRGDLYVGEDLYVNGDTTFKQIFAENIEVSGIGTIKNLNFESGIGTDLNLVQGRVGVATIQNLVGAAATIIEGTFVDLKVINRSDLNLVYINSGITTTQVTEDLTVTQAVIENAQIETAGVDDLFVQTGVATDLTITNETVQDSNITRLVNQFQQSGISSIGIASIGNLTVTGITTFEGVVDINKVEFVELSVTGVSSINELFVNTGVATDFTIETERVGVSSIGLASITKAEVSSLESFDNKLSYVDIGYDRAVGDGSFKRTGVGTIIGFTTITGSVFVDGDLTVTGIATYDQLNAEQSQIGILTVFTALDASDAISSFKDTTVERNLEVIGISTIGLSTIANGDININRNLTVNGITTFYGTVNINETEYVNINVSEKATINDLDFNVGFGTELRADALDAGITTSVFLDVTDTANIQTGIITDLSVTRQDVVYNETGISTIGYANITNENVGVSTIGVLSATNVTISGVGTFQADVDFEARLDIKEAYIQQAGIGTLFYQLGIGTYSQLGVASVGLASITEAQITTANVYRDNVAISSIVRAEIQDEFTERAYIDNLYYQVGVGTYSQLGVASVGLASITTAEVTTANVFTANVDTANIATGVATDAFIDNLYYQVGVGTYSQLGVASVGLASITTAEVTTANIFTANVDTTNVQTGFTTDAFIDNLYYQVGVGTFSQLGVASVGLASITTAEVTTANVYRENVAISSVGFATIGYGNTLDGSFYRAGVGTIIGFTTVTGNVFIDGNLSVTGISSVDDIGADRALIGILTVFEYIDNKRDLFTKTLQSRENTSIAGLTTVTGITTFSGFTGISGELSVDGNTEVTGVATVVNVTFNSGNIDIPGIATVGGNAFLGNDLSVAQDISAGRNLVIPGIATVGTLKATFGEIDFLFGTDVEFSTARIGFATITQSITQVAAIEQAYINQEVVGTSTVTSAFITDLGVSNNAVISNDLDVLGTAEINDLQVSTGDVNLDTANINVGVLTSATINEVSILSGIAVLQDLDVEISNTGTATIGTAFISNGSANLQLLNAGISTLGVASIGYVDIASGEADLEFLNVGVATIANIGISSGSADLQLINVDRANIGFASITEIDVESGQADLEFLAAGIATVGFASVTNLQAGVTTSGPLTVNGLVDITGNTTIDGTLGVTSSVTVGNNLSVFNTTSTNDLVVVGLADIERADIQLGLSTNFFIVTGTIATATVETSNTGFGSFGFAPGFPNPGPSTEKGSFYRTGIGTIVGFTTITGDIFLDGNLDVTGFTSFTKISAEQAIIGIATFNDAVINKGTLEVAGIATVGSLNVAGNAEIFSLEVTTNTALRGDLSIDGNIYSIGAANTFTQNVEINGDLEVDGETNLNSIVRIQGSNPLSGILTVSNVVNTDRLIARTRIDTPTINAATGNIDQANGTSLFYDTATITDIDAVDVNTDNLGVSNKADLNNVYVTGLSTFIGLSTFTNDLYAKDIYTQNTVRATNVIASANVQGDSATFASAGIDELASTFIDTVNLRVVGFATINDAEFQNIEVGFATAIGANLGELTVTGLTSTKDLTVTDSSSLFSVTVNDFLTVKGATTLEDDVRIDGNLELFGSADMLEVDVRNLRVAGVATVVGPFEAGSIINNGDLDQTGIATFRSGIEIATGNLDIITGNLNAVTGVITALSGETLLYDDVRALESLSSDKDLVVNRNARIVGVLTATDLRVTNDALVGNLYATGVVSATTAEFDGLTVNESLTTKDFEFTGVGIGSELDLDRITADTGEITVLTGFGVTFEEGAFTTSLDTRDLTSTGISSLNTVTAETVTATDVAVVNSLNFNIGVGTELSVNMIDAGELDVSFAQVGILTATLEVQAGLVTATTVSATTVNADFVNAKESIKLDNTFEILEFEVTGSGPTDILFTLDSLDYASFDVTVTAFSGTDVMSTKMHGVTLTGTPSTVLHNEYSTVASNGEFVEYDILPSGRNFSLTADNSTSGSVTYRVRAELTLRP